jgi:hypothetical protein
MNDRLDIALRVHAEPLEAAEAKSPRAAMRRGRGRDRIRHILVLDCETTTDATQRLLFGWYRYARIEWHGNRPEITVVEEGVFHADDLAELDLVGFGTLRAFVAAAAADVGRGFDRRIRFVTMREFLDAVLYPAAVKIKATIVGFNLPFDLSRLASDAGETRSRRSLRTGRFDRRFAGGFSLRLWPYRQPDGAVADHRYRPRVRVKGIDPRRSLMALSRTADPENSHQGQFLDLRALVFALTDRSHSLASAGEAFGLKRGKVEAPPHGVITPAYIAYARRDVEATLELFTKAAVEYVRHPIDRQMTKVFSPASIGKAYLRAMGIRPVLERQPTFPRDALGIGMLAYFGGRAEARIRRLPVPVRYLDFRSMYPTVNALMGLWDLLTAERIEVVDATKDVRTLLVGLTPQRVLDPAFWRSVVGFVQLHPAGDVLPVRAPYDASPGFQIGVNHLTSREPLWVSIPDIIQAALLATAVPDIIRAVRLVPVGRQDGLKPVRLRGTVSVNPGTEDFFRRVVEERIKLGPTGAAGDPEATRLERFLKVLANSTPYGIYAEMNPQPRSGAKTAVRVQGLDGAFDTGVERPELLGEYYFGPIAAVITGAARLMLAVLERLVTDAGGTWAMADTDSMAIVASREGAPIAGLDARVLTWAEAEGIRGRFMAVNPYDRAAVPGSILKLEAANLDESGERELWCFAISAKRYALFTLDPFGEPVLEKWSEHGLGHLLNPTDPDSDDRSWIRQIWEGLVRESLGLPVAQHDWFDRPAIGRMSVSSPELWRRFNAFNAGKPYADQIKPFNFLITAHVRAFGYPTGIDPTRFQLIAPYTLDARQWKKRPWLDHHSGGTFRITTTGEVGAPGIARVKTYRDVVAEYRIHPEAKSADPYGAPRGPGTVGLLQRRGVTAGRIRYIGKESNLVDEVDAGLIHDQDEVSLEYIDPRRDTWVMNLLPRLRAASSGAVARALGVNLSTVKRWKAGGQRPRPAQLRALAALLG